MSEGAKPAAAPRRLTPAQRRFLAEAANNWLGVAKMYGVSGFGKSARIRMAESLCFAGLMERYVHGSNEFRITKAGRAALTEATGGTNQCR